MKIRILSLLLIAVMLFGMLPLSALAAETAADAVVQITHISLNPSKDALGFKAKVTGNTESITEIGFSFRVSGGKEKVYTLTKTPEDGIFTARVKNILAAGGGEMILEAYAFVRMGDVTVTSKTESTSMKQTMQAVDGIWATFQPSQQAAVKTLCESFKAQVHPWNLNNIFGINAGFFGTIGNFSTSEHLELSQDTGANTGTVTVTEDGIAFGYVNAFAKDSFYLEADFHVNGILPTEGYPKFGLMVEDENVREYLYVDMNTALAASVVGKTTHAAGQDDWANTKTAVVEGMAFSGNGEKVTLGVLKQGKRLDLFVNGNYALTAMTNAGVSVAGIFSFNTGLTVTNYRVVTDGFAQLLEKIPAAELEKGDTFGSAYIHHTTGEVDLSQDKGSAPFIHFYGGAPRYAYVNDIYAEKFVFETQINVQSVLNGDRWPKFGITVNGDSEMVKFFVDMTPEMTATHVGVVYQPTGGGDDWNNSVSREVLGMTFSGNDSVKLKLVRDGRAYYFYVNDTLVLQNDLGFKTERGAVGIFSFNTELTAFGYRAAVGPEADQDVKKATQCGLTGNWFADNGDGSFTLSTDSDAQHKVDDLTRGGVILTDDFYTVSGRLSLTDAAPWGQARILVSADPRNEYFIALEKLGTDNYQIFTMSKADQDNWDVWQLIANEADYGNRNTMDFEVLVIGEQLYLLIDSKVVYNSNRVSMTNSTVKFTGFNIGTTTVSGLSAQSFANREAAQAYLNERTLAKESYAVTYKNELQTVGADPSVIMIEDGEDAGSYYMYVTSDELGNQGFLAYKSADLVNWECVGTALAKEEDSYLTDNYWAPEVIYDSESSRYYMFYSGFHTEGGVTRGYGDIAVSESPAGPFVPLNKAEPAFDFANMDKNHPLYETDTDGYMKVIDLSPFTDPRTGKKYVYFCHDVARDLGITTSGIYGMALNDDYTPDYTTVTALTGADSSLGEGKVNEAPFVVYKDGKYYLMYSANKYYQTSYCVRVAVADSPLGTFTKLSEEEGGYLLQGDAGTGHCSIVSRNGQDYIVYHAHKEKPDEALIRGIAMDELHWVTNGSGLLVPVVNGPSAGDMPLTTTGFANIANAAAVTATGIAEGSANALTDGVILHRDMAFLKNTVFSGEQALVTLQFDSPKTICAVMLCNGLNVTPGKVQSIRLHLAAGGSICYDGTAVLQTVPMEITKIEIVMCASDAPYTISEIVVLSRVV